MTAGPAPAPNVLAAIVAAVEVAWPAPPGPAPVPPPAGEAGLAPWRFSGRWWAARRTRDATFKARERTDRWGTGAT